LHSEMAEVDSPASLCLPHLARALELGAESKARPLLLASAASLDRAGEDMRRYALKRDAVREGLTTSDERGASTIGLSRMAGDRRLSGVAQDEDLF
jgi:hypothetical protein